MKKKLTAQELKALKNLYDIVHSPARMLATLQTDESIKETWDKLCEDICEKLNLEPKKITFNLETGEIDES